MSIVPQLRQENESVERSENQQYGEYKVTVHDYGDGLVEVSAGQSWTGFDKEKRLDLDEEERKKRDEENMKRSLRRTKKRVRQKIMAGGCDRFLTLTYHENMTERVRAIKNFAYFVKLVRQKVGHFHYVAILETQKRGAFHFHLAVDSFLPFPVIKALWMRAIGGNGSVHINRFHKVGLAMMAGYMTKYLLKAGENREKGQRLVWISKGIGIPEEVFFVGTWEEVMIFANAVAGSDGFIWNGMEEDEEVPRVWACSW